MVQPGSSDGLHQGPFLLSKLPLLVFNYIESTVYWFFLTVNILSGASELMCPAFPLHLQLTSGTSEDLSYHIYS